MWNSTVIPKILLFFFFNDLLFYIYDIRILKVLYRKKKKKEIKRNNY